MEIHAIQDEKKSTFEKTFLFIILFLYYLNISFIYLLVNWTEKNKFIVPQFYTSSLPSLLPYY